MLQNSELLYCLFFTIWPTGNIKEIPRTMCFQKYNAKGKNFYV